MRQTNISFLVSQVRAPRFGRRKGRRREEERKEEKKKKKRRNKGMDLWIFAWVLVLFGFLGFLVWISMGISCSILGFCWEIILTLDLLKLYG